MNAFFRYQAMEKIFFLLLWFSLIETAFCQFPKDTIEAKEQFALAIQQQQQGEYWESNKLLQATTSFYKQEKLWEDYIKSSNQIARNYWQLHQLDSSLQHSNFILDLVQLEQNSLLQADAFSNVGVVYDMRSEYDLALKYFHKCLDIRKVKLGEDHFETGKIYYNIGVCYSLQRNMNTAIEYYENALNNFKKNLGEEHPFLITVYQGMRDPYDVLDKNQEAIEQLEKALKIAKKIYPPGHTEIAGIINSIGLTYLDIPGAKDQAIKYIQNGYEMELKSLGDKHPDMVRIYTNMGILYAEIKNHELAHFYYQKALSLSKEVFGSKHVRNYYVYRGLGNLGFDKHQNSLALLSFHHAMLGLLPSIVDSSSLDETFDFLNIPMLSVLLVTTAYNDKTIALGRLIDDYPTNDYYKELYLTQLKTMNQLILRTKQDIYDIDDQVEVLEYAIEYTIRKTLFYKDLDPHKKQPQLLEEVILDADRCKSILLKAALSTSDAIQFGGVPDSLITKEIELKDAISNLEQDLYLATKDKNETEIVELSDRLFQLKQEKKAFNKNLETKHADYYNLKYKNNPITIQDIQNELLDEQTMILDYLYNGDSIYVFMITKNNVDVEIIALDKDFSNRIKKFRVELTNLKYIQDNPKEAYKSFCENAHYFYELLLKKYVPSNVKNIILMPDKELNRLPFESFLTALPKGQENDYNNLSYVIKQYNIRYAYSSELLLEFKQKKQKKSNNSSEILAFAASYDPSKATDELRSNLVALPGAQKEVETIGSLFKGQFYFGNEANEATFKKADFSKFSIVHLAMHGLMDKKNPMGSSMAFTKDSMPSTEDDYLCAYELTNMSINTNLVVLSACETGDGKHEAVEGIMSIGRSFMYAGVPSLIMTLWQVNDFSTSFIMQEFYQLLADGKTKSEALRQAKLNYLEHVKASKGLLSHPFFWAAFIQLGDDDNITIEPKNKPFSIFYWAIGILLLVGGFLVIKKIGSKKEFTS